MKKIGENVWSGFRVAAMVWLVLLSLTALTTLLHELPLPVPGIVAAVSIAAVKAYFVFIYFMHLRHEVPALRRLVAMTLFILLFLIALAFMDPIYR